MTGFLYALIAIAANVLASVLLKFSIGSGAKQKFVDVFFSAPLALTASALLYGVAFLSYATSLRFLPLHLAQPLTSALPIVLIAAASHFLFFENISPISLAGLMTIVLGVVLLALGIQR